MTDALAEADRRGARGPRAGWLAAALLGCAALGGCASFSNPTATGVPVHRLPPEMLGRPREDERTIPLSLLRQKPPDVYRLDTGDVLGVWVDGVLGDRIAPVVTRLPESPLAGPPPPAIGYPIPVRENGTISLPLIDPIPVRGKTVAEVQEAVRTAYTVTRRILQPGRERILVELQRSRTYHVLVIRQDSGGVVVGPAGGLGQTKRGTGFPLDLPAGENDVLNALARTGGFPGLDARNEVVIERGAARTAAELDAIGRCPPEAPGQRLAGLPPGQVVRIPLRLPPDVPVPFRPEDVVLNSGDILFIESRDTEVFYTAGLLGGGQYILPRDYDLDVLDAVSLVRGPLTSGGLLQNNFTGAVLNNGLGFPSPSQLTIVRKLRDGRQVIIKVDLNLALVDARERVLVQPKDLLILQETLGESLTRYITTNFKLNFIGTILRQNDAIATTTINAP
jgi:protein involved in polysaccharide export with SLBB domain